MPDWYGKADKELKIEIHRIALKNHINFKLVLDSKSLEDCREHILNTLVMISEQGRTEENYEIYKENKKGNKKKKSKGNTEKTKKETKKKVQKRKKSNN